MLVQLINHQESETLADVLRLFYPGIEKEEGRIRVRRTCSQAEDASQSHDLIIVSELDQKVSKEDLRNHRECRPIKVSTRFSDQKLPSESPDVGASMFCQAVVKPHEVRRELKRQLYLLLSRLENIRFPWGSLTGIRPTQIAWQSYCEADRDRANAEQNLVEHWLVSPAKAKLAVETALAEEDALSELDPKLPLLYLGIPFCPSRCAYCSFISRDAIRQKSALPLYVKALQAEIRAVGQYFRERNLPFQALYLGGGTPTSLPTDLLRELIDTMRDELELRDNCEITVEAGRPDTINREVLVTIRTLGDVRLCINPQTMHAETLRRIGRKHTVRETFEAFALAREAGFQDINMDLILGLPGETAAQFISSVEQLIALGPESLTLHTLALKRSAHLQEEAAERYLRKRFPDSELSEALATADRLLRDASYQPYYLYRQKNVRGGLENTGYALSGRACLYNVGMMSDRLSVVGLGSGSSSKKVEGRKVERCYNSKDLLDYSARITEMIERKLEFFGNLRRKD